MNRRDFVKSIGVALAGPSVLGGMVIGAPLLFVSNHVDPVQAWPPIVGGPQRWPLTNNPTDGILKFPEQVKSLQKFGERLFAFCEESIWEIEESENGLQGTNIWTSEVVQSVRMFND